jgi:hypothetical protein
MIRYFLAKGDRAGDAVITEGLSTSTYQEANGRRVELATVYMQTYCHACKKAGFICPSGPRLPGTAENGKQHALSGDINICDCKPPPVFFAVRNMTENITSSDIERMGAVYHSVEKPLSKENFFDELFQLHDAHSGRPLANVEYAIKRASGDIENGVTDRDGYTHRLVKTSQAEAVDIYCNGADYA